MRIFLVVVVVLSIVCLTEGKKVKDPEKEAAKAAKKEKKCAKFVKKYEGCMEKGFVSTLGCGAEEEVGRER